LGQHLFRSVKYVYICHFPFFLHTITTFSSHYVHFTSLTKPASSNLCTLAFATFTFSSAILLSFCFFSLAHRMTCSRCSIMSLLTPTKSRVDHENTTLFLSRKPSSFAYSSWLASAPMHMVLFRTLGSNSTFLNSTTVSIIFLYSVRGSVVC
jgi:hypothetical protein